MSNILANVNKKHASDKVKYYALYAYYFLGHNKTQISKIYSKSVSTITNWVTRYEATGSRNYSFFTYFWAYQYNKSRLCDRPN